MTALEFGRQQVERIAAEVAADPRTSSRWEGEFSEAFIARIQTAKTFVDCGAEFGFYIRLALKHGPLDLQIVAFEPDPDRFVVLVDAFRRNRNVFVLPFAVSDKIETQRVVKPAVDVSAAFEGLLHPNGGSFEVSTTFLDDHFRLATVDVIKMDIEGAEDKALAGAESLISRSPDLTLFIEFHPCQTVEAERARAGTILMLEDHFTFDATANATMFHGGRVVLRSAHATHRDDPSPAGQ